MLSCRKLPTLTLFTFCIYMMGCGSSGPATIQPGTPAFSWSSAKQAYQSGDYLRTVENLSKLTQRDNEYRVRAEASLIMLSAGLTQGYMDMADAYDAGAKQNRENALAFRKQANVARASAKSMALQFVEAMHHFSAGAKDATIAFEFGYPTGSLADVPALAKISKGMMPLGADAELATKNALQKGVVWSACRAVGAEDDSAKAMEIFKQSPLQVPREKFMFGMAGAMFEQSDLFGPKQLDEPVRQKMLCTEAAEALKQVPESKDSKSLDGKIQKALKSIKAT